MPHPPQDLQFRDHALQTFLDHVASKTPTPGGGSVAAVAGAMAAGLVAMTARLSSTRLMDAPTITAEADRLREIALRLADHDAIAYQDVRPPAPFLRAPTSITGDTDYAKRWPALRMCPWNWRESRPGSPG